MEPSDVLARLHAAVAHATEPVECWGCVLLPAVLDMLARAEAEACVR